MNNFDLHDVETRVTDAVSGGQKGKKLCQIGALDPVAMIETGRVAGMGANKYAAFNYLKGFDWSLAYNAMQRHANLFWAGEDIDDESRLCHMAHAAWMAMCIISFYRRGLGNDDRPPRFIKDTDGQQAGDDVLQQRAPSLADMGLLPEDAQPICSRHTGSLVLRPQVGPVGGMEVSGAAQTCWNPGATGPRATSGRVAY